MTLMDAAGGFVPVARVSTGSGGATPLTVQAGGHFEDVAWGADFVTPGEEIELRARLVRFAEVPRVTFEVYDATRADPLAGDPIATLEAAIEDDVVRARWIPGEPPPEPAGGEPGAGDTLLARGSRGDAVEELQEVLVARGYSVAVDGEFGPETDDGVRWFQEDYGLAVDGKVGPATWGALRDRNLPPQPQPPAGVLKRGDRYAKVRRLQEELNAKGASLVVDGLFGAQTEEATRSFQEREDLAVDGRVGALTWSALLAGAEPPPGGDVDGPGGGGSGGGSGEDADDDGLPHRMLLVARAEGVLAVGPTIWLHPDALLEPRWEPEVARVGQQVSLRCSAPPGHEVLLRVFSRGRVAGEALVDELQAVADGDGVAAARWTVPDAFDADEDAGDGDGGPGGDEDDAPTGDVDPTLSPGEDALESVYALQEALGALHRDGRIEEDPGPPSDQLDDATLRAVVDFKRRFGIEPADAGLTRELRRRVGEERPPGGREAPPPPALPDYWFEAELRARYSAQSPTLDVVPACSVSLQVSDPANLGKRLLALPERFSDDLAADLGTLDAEARVALKERLQVLGYYHDVFDQSDAVTRPFVRAVRRFREDHEDAAGDALLEALVAACRRATVVAPDGADELPREQGRPVLNGRDADVLFPGAFCIEEVAQLANDAAPERRFLEEERRFRDANNPLLGKVALVAQVRVPGRDAEGNDVVRDAGEGLPVVFELVPAFLGETPAEDLQIFAELGVVADGGVTAFDFDSPDFDPDAGEDPPSVPHGPRRYIERLVEDWFDPSDEVQRANAHQTWGGGKADLAAAGDLFLLGDPGLGERWPWRAAAGPNEHSVRVATGPDGSAAVMFSPFRAGGEVYRVRAYVEGGPPPGRAPAVGAPGLDEPFSRAGHPAITGRLRVWRRFRLQRFLQRPLPAGEHDLNHWHPAVGGDPPEMSTIDNERLEAELRKAFFRADAPFPDPEAIPLGGPDEDGSFTAAHEHVLVELKQYEYLTDRYDLDALLDGPRGYEQKAFLVTLNPPETYNAERSAPYGPLDYFDEAFQSDWSWLCRLYLNYFMAAFTHDGDPGLTLIQAIAGDELSYAKRYDVRHGFTIGPCTRGDEHAAAGDPLVEVAFPDDLTFARGDRLRVEARHADGARSEVTLEVADGTEFAAFVEATIGQFTMFGLEVDDLMGGPFQAGELLRGATSGVEAAVRFSAPLLVDRPLEEDPPTFEVGETVRGAVSGATATVRSVRDNRRVNFVRQGKLKDGRLQLSFTPDLDREGVQPGITVHRRPAVDADGPDGEEPADEPAEEAVLEEQATPVGAPGGTHTPAGRGTPHRGAYMFLSKAFWDGDLPDPSRAYFASSGDAFTAATLHEVGHVLFLRHYQTAEDQAYQERFADHDSDDRCIMGYLDCDGDLCGRCLLHLRGWDLSTF